MCMLKVRHNFSSKRLTGIIKMIEDILQNCRPQTKLCIAANISCVKASLYNPHGERLERTRPDLSKIPLYFSLIQNNIFQVFIFIFEATAEEALSHIFFYLFETPQLTVLETGR